MASVIQIVSGDIFYYTENLDPVVKIQSLTIITPNRPDLVLSIPFVPNAKGYAFSLKDGSRYRLKFSFTVSNNIVSGLRYTNTVWKTGVRGRERERRIEVLLSSFQLLSSFWFFW